MTAELRDALQKQSETISRQSAEIERLKAEIESHKITRRMWQDQCEAWALKAPEWVVEKDNLKSELSRLRAALGAAETQAARDVLAERERQKSAEGWTPEHDDRHDSKELARAAAVYALHAAQPPRMIFSAELAEEVSENWPWAKCYFKPRGPRRDLVRAAALIIAEIERLDRATTHSAQEPSAEEKDKSNG